MPRTKDNKAGNQKSTISRREVAGNENETSDTTPVAAEAKPRRRRTSAAASAAAAGNGSGSSRKTASTRTSRAKKAPAPTAASPLGQTPTSEAPAVAREATVQTERRRGLSPEQRRRMIAEAAYYRAQQRGFAGGDPQRDWLEAEAEVDARQRA